MRRALIPLKLKREGGFTLLELLVVIIITGLLIFLIVPSVLSGPLKARDKERKSDLGQVQIALESYHADNDTYPSGSYTSLGSTLVPHYIKKLPVDPKASQNYTYTSTNCSGSSCTGYKLDVVLENTHDKQIKVPPATYELTNKN